MHHWVVNSKTGRAAIVVLTMTLSQAVSSGVIAQTLMEPNSKLKPSQSSGLAKPQPIRRTKSCSSFGDGFVQIAGTDTCVKIGGFVTIEGAVSHGR
jgi:Porin subfamily